MLLSAAAPRHVFALLSLLYYFYHSESNKCPTKKEKVSKNPWVPGGFMLNYHLSLMRAFGAVGSAPHWQCGGQGFESPKVHHLKPSKIKALRLRWSRFFLCFYDFFQYFLNCSVFCVKCCSHLTWYRIKENRQFWRWNKHVINLYVFRTAYSDHICVVIIKVNISTI